MCYSAMVEQSLKNLGMRFDARIDISIMEDIFNRRARGEKISLSKAFEYNFMDPQSAPEKGILKNILEFRSWQITQLESEMFTQITRLNVANEAVKKKPLKPTKKSLQEQAVSQRQIDRIKKRLEKFKSEKLAENDSRIYSYDWAPVLIWQNGERVIVPMRYHLRPPGMQESFDRTYPGCYNARRDSLNGFWSKEFGQKHAIILISSFFENVKLHDLENRSLAENESEKNVVLQFIPEGTDYMIVPCIWDHWEGKDKAFDSFAMITDEPPPEVRSTGHDRCPIFLNEVRIDDWLRPQGKSSVELFSILNDRQRPLYKHAIAG